MVLGLMPAFLRARLEAISCISLPMWDWLMETRSEEHTSELQSLRHLVCRLLLEKITPGAAIADQTILTITMLRATRAPWHQKYFFVGVGGPQGSPLFPKETPAK